MSYEVLGSDISLPAAASMSGNQYCFVVLNSSGQVALPAAAGALVLGVLQDKPQAQGNSCGVRTINVTKVIASGAIAVGTTVATDASGHAKAAVVDSVSGAAVTGSNIAGIALAAASALGDIIPILLTRGASLPTTQA